MLELLDRFVISPYAGGGGGNPVSMPKTTALGMAQSCTASCHTVYYASWWLPVPVLLRKGDVVTWELQVVGTTAGAMGFALARPTDLPIYPQFNDICAASNCWFTTSQARKTYTQKIKKTGLYRPVFFTAAGQYGDIYGYLYSVKVKKTQGKERRSSLLTLPVAKGGGF